MLNLKEQIFGEKGHSLDLQLDADELSAFRALIGQHWMSVLTGSHPELAEEAASLGLENYHLISKKVDHKRLWPKSARVLPLQCVRQLKSLPFFETLRDEFGAFTISDVYDTHQHYGQEEIYWRLVRPNVESDVGVLHTDKWFHKSFNMGSGMFPPGTPTVKLWIPIYCEPGKNGLAIVDGSHLKDWRFHVEDIEGFPKPVPDDDLSDVGERLVHADAGNVIVFHENMLHGGVVNQGTRTRVSAEITLVLSSDNGAAT